MALFNQQPNSRDEKRDVNTNGLQFYNLEGISPSTLKLGYWNDTFITFRIHPARPKDQQTEREKYDYEKSTSTAVPPIKVAELLEGMPRIIEAFNEGKDASCYVDVSGNNLVGYGTMKYKGKQILYVAIHRNLSDNRIPENSAYFQFQTSYRIEDYDPSTGKYEQNGISLGDFYLFRVSLEAQLKAVTKATAHSIRAVESFYQYRMEAKIDAIAKATNADVNGISSSRYGGSRLFGFANADKATMSNVVSAAEDALSDEEKKTTVTNTLPGLDENEDMPF